MIDIDKKIKLPNRPNFEYFNNNALRLWDYESYKKHKTTQTGNPPRNKKIRASYKEAIKDIRNLSGVSEEIKEHLDSFIKDNSSEDKEGKTKVINQYITQYINYGHVEHQGPSQADNMTVNRNIKSTKKRKYNHNSDGSSDDEHPLAAGIPSRLKAFNPFISDDTFETNDCGQYSKALPTRKYTLTMQEVNIYESNKKEELIYDDSSSLYERLAISFIKYNVGLSKDKKLGPKMLDDQEYSNIREWRMKLKKNQLYYPPIATTPSQLHLNTLLCNMTDTIMNDKQAPGKKSEIGFTVDNVSPLFKYLFPANGGLSYKWEKPSILPTDKSCKRVRTDFVLVANGQEAGCGEIKFPGTISQLSEENRARIAEMLKRQLHVRIMKSKDPKEFVTFGMVFNGLNVELYMMTFDFENTFPYQFYEIEKLNLPTSPDLYTSIEETIEYLASFKTFIVSSLADEKDAQKTFIYHDYIHLFKPTISFKND